MSFEHIAEWEGYPRKEHPCVWCGGRILVGEYSHRRTYRFDGDFRSDRLHHDCFLAMNRSYMHPDDGFEEFGYMRGKTIDETEDYRQFAERVALGPRT